MAQETNEINKSVIIIRIGEIFLKGKNRRLFDGILSANLKSKLSGTECKLSFERNRYIVSDYEISEERRIIDLLKTVFGIHSVSPAKRVRSEFKIIAAAAVEMVPSTGTFRVTANRGDKTFKMNSMQINCELGAEILKAYKNLSVDLHNPDFTVNADVREEGFTYIYFDKIPGAGGMPSGSAGSGLVMLSGGIDSPVAAYQMAKRGLSLTALHFHSYPYTSENAQQKVIRLKNTLESFAGKIPLFMVPFTKIQEAIHKYCSESFMITIMRRIMMRIAEDIAIKNNCGCIINGESLGQVASQTLESITVTNEAVKSLPVFRPLIGFDKQEIVELSVRIGTYKTSVEPYEDCCTVFLPAKPVIKPKLKQCFIEENRIPELENLIGEAIENTVLI